MKIVFWEKPGCAGNARQRALLARAGHELDVRSLAATRWTREALLSWLDALPVAEWFNPRAPRVRDGLLDPARLSRDEALALLAEDPLLLRRPLLEAGGVRLVGFDLGRVEAVVGPLPATPQARAEGLEACAAGQRGEGCAHDPRAPAGEER